jgi:hypothetical protein
LRALVCVVSELKEPLTESGECPSASYGERWNGLVVSMISAMYLVKDLMVSDTIAVIVVVWLMNTADRLAAGGEVFHGGESAWGRRAY